MAQGATPAIDQAWARKWSYPVTSTSFFAFLLLFPRRVAGVLLIVCC